MQIVPTSKYPGRPVGISGDDGENAGGEFKDTVAEGQKVFHFGQVVVSRTAFRTAPGGPLISVRARTVK